MADCGSFCAYMFCGVSACGSGKRLLMYGMTELLTQAAGALLCCVGMGVTVGAIVWLIFWLADWREERGRRHETH